MRLSLVSQVFYYCMSSSLVSHGILLQKVLCTIMYVQYFVCMIEEMQKW